MSSRAIISVQVQSGIYTPALVVAAPVTAAAVLANNTQTPVNATAGAISMSLPTGQGAGSVINVYKYDSSANAVTVTGGAEGTETLAFQGQGISWVADSAGAWHPLDDRTPATAYDVSGTSATETTRAKAAEALLAPKASPTFTGTALATTTSATAVPLTIEGAPSQTADLLDVKNSAGTVLASTDFEGRQVAQAFLIPAAANLAVTPPAGYSVISGDSQGTGGGISINCGGHFTVGVPNGYGVFLPSLLCVDNVLQVSAGSGLQLQGASKLWSGTGAPTIAGTVGDFYFRIDTPTVANQTVYTCTVTGAAGAATWVPVISAGGATTFPLSDTAAATSSIVLESNVTGDTAERFTLDADGSMGWGSGTAPVSGATPGAQGIILHNYVNDLYDLTFYGSTGIPAATCGIRYDNRAGAVLDAGLADLQLGTANITAALRVNRNRVQIQGNYSALAALTVIQNSATAPVLAVTGASGQTADLLDVTNSAGTVLGGFGFDGRLMFSGTSGAIGVGGVIRIRPNAANDTAALWVGPNAGALTHTQLYSGGGGELDLVGPVSVGLIDTAPTYGGGTGPMMFLANDTADPTAAPVGGGILYVSTGALKYMGTNGAVTSLTKRVVTVAQSATPAINSNVTDIASITGLAQPITSMTSGLTGTPHDGDALTVRITDNGTGQAITWGASFASTTVALPTLTVASTMLRVGFAWNTAGHWDCVAKA